MRKITISHARHEGGEPFSIMSEAKTFGEFKASLYEIKGLDVTGDNKVTLVSHGERDLNMDSQELPDAELTLMVTPRNMKAGNDGC